MSRSACKPLKTSSLYQSEQDRHRNYITRFRVNKCQNSCKDEYCGNLHSNQSPRRVPVMLSDGVWNYIPKPCKNLDACKMGDRCRFAHSKSECSYHPLVYKVSDCKFPSLEIGKCSKWGFDCSFAHEVPDRRLKGLQKGLFDPLTYKTIKCPDKLCKSTSCTFFHNNLDRRRSQEEYFYSQTPCKFTFKDRTFINPDFCPNKDSCELAHTKNEVYFHKDLYLTQLCKSEPCYAPYCAFIHREGNTIKEENKAVFVEKERLIVEEKSEESVEKEVKCEIPLKLRCKACTQREIKWVLECGTLVCGKCLGNRCIKCEKNHATRIDL